RYWFGARSGIRVGRTARRPVPTGAGRCASRSPLFRFSDAPQVFVSADENVAVGNRDRRERALAEAVLRDEFPFRRGLENERVARVVDDVDESIAGRDGGTPRRRAAHALGELPFIDAG